MPFPLFFSFMLRRILHENEAERSFRNTSDNLFFTTKLCKQLTFQKINSNTYTYVKKRKIILPILPYRIRHDCSHDLPMGNCTTILVLMKPARFLCNQNTPSTLLNLFEFGWVHLVLGHKVVLTRLASQEIGFDWIPEAKGCVALLAEDYHVGEIELGIRGCVFAEDPARREDCLNCAHRECGWVK